MPVVAHGHNTECLFFVFEISVIVSLLVLEKWSSQQPGLPSGFHFGTLSLDCSATQAHRPACFLTMRGYSSAGSLTPAVIPGTRTIVRYRLREHELNEHRTWSLELGHAANCDNTLTYYRDASIPRQRRLSGSA
jgi:hypothetical protein